MKRIIMTLLIAVFALSIIQAKNVNIIMKDGTVLKGDLIGKTSEEVYIQDTNSKSVEVKVSDIKSLFDSDTGDQINLAGDTAAPNSNQPNTADTNVVISQPDVAVIPNTYVYYYSYDNYDCFYYAGYWWRPWHRVWYRSAAYNGGWVLISPEYVPYNVMHLPPRWRDGIAIAPRIGWGDVRYHWQEWERTRYWSKVGWRREEVIRQNNRAVVRDKRTGENKKKKESDRK